MTETVDAVVVGAGHNGLVAANLLADAGWDVLVCEAQPTAGGAARSAEFAPGFGYDEFSAFYPLGAASPVLRDLDLGPHGLEWVHAPAVLAHILADGRGARLSRDPLVTAASVEGWGQGDGDAWLREHDLWQRIKAPLLAALFHDFPPVRAGLSLARTLGLPDLLRFARFAVTPVRRHGEETFRGEGAKLLLAGNALHTDLPPEGAGSAIFGWLLAMLGQDVGFPVPRGGAGRLADALCSRLDQAGGTVRLGTRVEQVTVRHGRAVGVVTSSGPVRARRAVLADVDAPTLLLGLVGEAHLHPRTVADLQAFQWDNPTLKLNWGLRAPIPWTAPEAHGAGTVHLGADLDGLSRYATSLAVGELPPAPFLLAGQMTTSDPTRSPAGTESAWAYTHLPRAVAADASAVRRHIDRVEEVMEVHAPGFRDLVEHRVVQAPLDLQSSDANLSLGAVNAGTAALHQELVFRPIPGLARPETPVRRLYFAGATAHPGGGVHGGPGAAAARAALLGSLRRELWYRALRATYR